MPCWCRVISARQIDCGELTIPENWTKPESKLIHLPVVTFRATAAPREPILFLNGVEAGESAGRLALVYAGANTGKPRLYTNEHCAF